MKKLMMVVVALALMATAGFAATGVLIDWSTTYGIYDHGAVDLTSTTTGGILDNYAITWQLIYSVNDTAETPDPLNVAGGYVSTDPLADDVVWATRTFAQDNGSASDGTEWDVFVYFVSGDTQYINTGWTTAGYVFQRVFEGSPAVDSWYFDSEPEPLVVNPEVAQTSYIDVSGGGTSGIQPDTQIPAAPVPEPATMGLLGLGALTMAIRRRRG